MGYTPLKNTVFSGDVKVETPAGSDNDTSAASTAYVQTECGLLIPKSLLTTRGDIIRRGASAPERVALGVTGKVLRSDGTDPVWDDIAGSYSAAVYLANSGAPTHTSNAGWQKVADGGGTDTWTSAWDVRPSGVSAQVDTATNKRIDIRKTGLYLVTASVRFSAISADKTVGVGVYVSGVQTIIEARTTSVAATPNVRVSEVMSLSSGGYLELYAYQSDSASEAYDVSLTHNNRLSATYIGPAS